MADITLPLFGQSLLISSKYVSSQILLFGSSPFGFYPFGFGSSVLSLRNSTSVTLNSSITFANTGNSTADSGTSLTSISTSSSTGTAIPQGSFVLTSNQIKSNTGIFSYTGGQIVLFGGSTFSMFPYGYGVSVQSTRIDISTNASATQSNTVIGNTSFNSTLIVSGQSSTIYDISTQSNEVLLGSSAFGIFPFASGISGLNLKPSISYTQIGSKSNVYIGSTTTNIDTQISISSLISSQAIFQANIDTQLSQLPVNVQIGTVIYSITQALASLISNLSEGSVVFGILFPRKFSIKLDPEIKYIAKLDKYK